MKNKINDFIKSYTVIRKTYYTDVFLGFPQYKHFFIIKRSGEIAFAFESDAEMLEFIDNNLEGLRKY